MESLVKHKQQPICFYAIHPRHIGQAEIHLKHAKKRTYNEKDNANDMVLKTLGEIRGTADCARTLTNIRGLAHPKIS
jgi:hypothetical protein